MENIILRYLDIWEPIEQYEEPVPAGGRMPCLGEPSLHREEAPPEEVVYSDGDERIRRVGVGSLLSILKLFP